MATSHTIAISTHGRYLVEPPSRGDPVGLLAGCHGYGESADVHLERLRSIPGADQWLLVSVQGLHRFYRGRSEDVVASWMTSQDRELAIADNSAYVAAVLNRAMRDARRSVPLVFAGFSQGVAMAFRAACTSTRETSGLIAAGGDVPPELGRDQLARIPTVLLARGERDEWYSPAKWTMDQGRLRQAGAFVREFAFEGGHEWNADVSRVAGELLARLKRR